MNFICPLTHCKVIFLKEMIVLFQSFIKNGLDKIYRILMELFFSELAHK